MNESVLFGSRLTFLANHYKASYSNGVVNIDHGSIGFITDGTDNQIEPYYLHGEWDDFEQDAKNVKVLRLFQNDNLVFHLIHFYNHAGKYNHRHVAPLIEIFSL